MTTKNLSARQRAIRLGDGNHSTRGMTGVPTLRTAAQLAEFEAEPATVRAVEALLRWVRS